MIHENDNMNMQTKPIQDRMFHEMKEGGILEMSQGYARDYLARVFDREVFPTVEALRDLRHFDEELPLEPCDAREVIDQLHQYGSPATVAQVGGRYFGFVNGSVVPAGLAAKNLSLAWDQNTAMQVLSPICAKLEAVVEGWLTGLFELPQHTAAGFVSGTSMATFCGLAAARYRLLEKLGWDINERGLFDAPKLRIVTSKQAHSTVVKAIGLLGFGKDNVEWVDVDEQGRMLPGQVPVLDERTILILQAGNVNSGSFEDFDSLCDQAQEAGAWVHIDGAFGLWARAVNNLKYLTKGMEKASSWSVDGHKTLNTPYDSGIVLCEDREALVAALHMSGSYLVRGDERDGMFFTPEMSRRSRIVELWATLKYLGKSGIDQMIYNMHLRAQQFAKELAGLEGFTVLNDVVFNQVIVRCETDDLTEAVTRSVQEMRTCWVGGSFWEGAKVTRISVCSWATTERDVSDSVNSFRKALDQVKRRMVTLK